MLAQSHADSQHTFRSVLYFQTGEANEPAEPCGAARNSKLGEDRLSLPCARPFDMAGFVPHRYGERDQGRSSGFQVVVWVYIGLIGTGPDI